MIKDVWKKCGTQEKLPGKFGEGMISSESFLIIGNGIVGIAFGRFNLKEAIEIFIKGLCFFSRIRRPNSFFAICL